MGLNQLAARITAQEQAIETLKVRLLEVEGRVLTLENALEKATKPTKRQSHEYKPNE